jgi:hypothetical protein
MSRRRRRWFFLGIGAVLLLVLGFLSGLFEGILGHDSAPRGPTGGADGRSGGVEGRVVSASGKGAPGGLRVIARGGALKATTTTDDAGRFRFLEVPKGTTVVEASVGPLAGSATINEGPVEIRLPGECTVAGRVVSDLTSESIPRAVVRCAGRTIQAGERGEFRFEKIPVPDARPPRIDVASPDRLPLKYDPPLDRRWDDLFLRMKAR